MSTQTTPKAKATNTQLAYMRALCDSTGSDFVYPGTARNASRVIGELKTLASWQDVAVVRMTELLSTSGLPTPDLIERAGTELRFLWSDRKVAVVIDLEDFNTNPSDDTVVAIAA